MMRNVRGVLVAGVVVVATLATAQSVGKRKVQAGDDIATMSDFSAAFGRMEQVLGRLVGVALSLPKLPNGESPAKRSAVVSRLSQVFEGCKGKVRLMPRPQPLPPEGLGIPVGHPQRVQLEKLIRWGLVSSTSALATSPSDTLTLVELGDSIGFFLLRMADLTHRPNQKFSPVLGGGD